MKRVPALIAILVMIFVGSVAAQKSYVSDIEKWRADHEAELKKEKGWVTVVGLFLLKEGTNTVGAGSGYDIELTDNFRGGKFGEIQFHDGKAALTVASGVEAKSDDKPFTSGELVSDEHGKQNIIKTGSQSFYLINREG